MNFKIWIHTLRIHTLPLSLSSIILSSFISYHRGFFKLYIFIFSCITALLLQMIANFANDYGDAMKGVDNIKYRLGPIRYVQIGTISYKLIKKIIILLSLLTIIIYFILLNISNIKLSFFNFILYLTLIIIFLYAAINYTIGKYPYGYMGYGDISVFIFFGIIPFHGIYFLYTFDIFCFNILPLSLSIGLLSTAVLNINNMRDIKNDFKNFKHTIVTKIGIRKSKIYHICLIVISIILGVLYNIVNYHNFYQHLLFLLVIFLLCIHIYNIIYIYDQKKFNKELKFIILINVLYSISIGLGQII